MKIAEQVASLRQENERRAAKGLPPMSQEEALAFRSNIISQDRRGKNVAKAEKATRAVKEPKPKKEAAPKRELPAAPEGWERVGGGAGFVRYARRLKSSGQPISGYDTAKAETPAQKQLVQQFQVDGHEGRYVVVNHTTGETSSFKAWADAYAETCRWSGKELSKSVQATITRKGRAKKETAAKAEASGSETAAKAPAKKGGKAEKEVTPIPKPSKAKAAKK